MHEGNYLEEAQMLKDQYTEIEKELKDLREENLILKQNVEEQVGISIHDLDSQTSQVRFMRRYVKSFKKEYIAYNAFLVSILDNIEDDNIDNAKTLLECLLDNMSKREYYLNHVLKNRFLFGPSGKNEQSHKYALAYRKKLNKYKVKAEKRHERRNAD